MFVWLKIELKVRINRISAELTDKFEINFCFSSFSWQCENVMHTFCEHFMSFVRVCQISRSCVCICVCVPNWYYQYIECNISSEYINDNRNVLLAFQVQCTCCSHFHEVLSRFTHATILLLMQLCAYCMRCASCLSLPTANGKPNQCQWKMYCDHDYVSYCVQK